MIKFLLYSVGALILCSFVLDILSGRAHLGNVGVLAVLVVLLFVLSSEARPYIIGFAIFAWLAWAFLFPVYQKLRGALAEGKSGTTLVFEAAKEILRDHTGPFGGALFGLGDVEEEGAIAQDLCLKLPFAQAKFGLGTPGAPDPMTITYCERLDTGIFGLLKAKIDELVGGAAGAAYPFIVQGDPSGIDGVPYLACVQSYTPEAERRVCNTSPLVTNAHVKRLCFELAQQVAVDGGADSRKPLAPGVAWCRSQYVVK